MSHGPLGGGLAPTLAALALALAPATASAADMTVAEFLARAEVLERQGAMAMFAKDMVVLHGEIGRAGAALRTEATARRKTGGTPAVCLPARARADPEEVLAAFRAVPPEARTMPVAAAFRTLMKRKYPCAEAPR